MSVEATVTVQHRMDHRLHGVGRLAGMCSWKMADAMVRP